MKLFDEKKVKKFFRILGNLERGIPKEGSRYKGLDKNNPDITPCEMEVFVKRTVSKWFTGKHLIYYNVGQFDNEYKQYLYISHLSFALGYGLDLKLVTVDYGNPTNLMDSVTINEGEILRAEGEWCENADKHAQLIKMFEIDLPEKEYVFKAVDWNRFPKESEANKMSRKKTRGMIETTVSVKAKTERQAFKEREKLQKKLKEQDIMIHYDILEVK